jgi:AcrR family transcriptional regulator
LIEHGYQAVGIEAIAEAAGLTTGAIYSLFGSKRGPLPVLSEPLEAIQASLGSACAEPTATAAEIITVYVCAYHDSVVTEAGWQALRLEVESLALIMLDGGRHDLVSRSRCAPTNSPTCSPDVPLGTGPGHTYRPSVRSQAVCGRSPA